MSSIQVKNLTIKFPVYNDQAHSLKEYFSSIFKRDRSARHDDYLAVNNISFGVNPGDRLGIIGKNGAGKSTLLKAICRIYEPSEGEVITNGTIAPMLEIGAGFHPEFSGRENIYLNGAILGYTKKQLKKIEPEVIAFSELEDFIDTPVKHYSTGMYMRLAFALSTAINPDILILDEIFNGGDAKFMAKAKKRMYSLIDQASIVIVVSHDHSLMQSLCNRVIWIDHGKLIDDGAPEQIVSRYLSA